VPSDREINAARIVALRAAKSIFPSEADDIAQEAVAEALNGYNPSRGSFEARAVFLAKQRARKAARRERERRTVEYDEAGSDLASRTNERELSDRERSEALTAETEARRKKKEQRDKAARDVFQRQMPFELVSAIDSWLDARNNPARWKARRDTLKDLLCKLDGFDRAVEKVFESLEGVRRAVDKVADKPGSTMPDACDDRKRRVLPKYHTARKERTVISVETTRTKRLVLPAPRCLTDPLEQIAHLVTPTLPEASNAFALACRHPAIARIEADLWNWCNAITREWTGREEVVTPGLVPEGFLTATRKGDQLLLQIVAAAVVAQYRGGEEATAARIYYAIDARAGDKGFTSPPGSIRKSIDAMLPWVRSNSDRTAALRHHWPSIRED